MKSKIKVLLLLGVLLNSLTINLLWAEADCLKKPELLHEKIISLQKEVNCANAHSFDECRLLFDAGKKEEKSLVSSIEELQRDEIPYCPNVTTKGFVGTASVFPLSGPFLAQARALLNATSITPRREFVNSVEDFYHHTRLHKKRVLKLGMELLKRYPEEFKNVTPEMLVKRIGVHDDAKLLYKFDDLYEYYGKHAPRSVIDPVNDIDDFLTNQANKELGLEITDDMDPKEVARIQKTLDELDKLEKIPDWTDRGGSKVTAEEMGRPTKSASEFMKIIGEKDPKMFEMADSLAEDYDDIVKGDEYRKMTPAQRIATRSKLMGLRFKNKYYRAGIPKLSRSLSARVLAKQAMGAGLRGASWLSKMTSSLKFAKASIYGELMIGLFDSALNVGCSEKNEHYDWQKNSFFSSKKSCTVAKDLTPNFINFLFMDEQEQIKAISEEGSNKHLCKLVDDVYKKQQDEKYKKIQCTPNGLDMQVSTFKGLSARFDSDGHLTRLDIRGLQNTSKGGLISADLNSDEKFSKFCYKNHRSAKITCSNSKDLKNSKGPEKDSETLLSSLRFDIQQSRDCCLGEYSASATESYCKNVANIEHVNSSTEQLHKVGFTSAH